MQICRWRKTKISNFLRLLAGWWKKLCKLLICNSEIWNLDDFGLEIIHCVSKSHQKRKVQAHSSLTPHRRRLVCASHPLVDRRRPTSPHIHRDHQSRNVKRHSIFVHKVVKPWGTMERENLELSLNFFLIKFQNCEEPCRETFWKSNRSHTNVLVDLTWQCRGGVGYTLA